MELTYSSVKNETLLQLDVILQALSRRIWRLVYQTEVDSLLDLGCGYGFHISFPFAEYKIGLDVHEPSLRYAKDRFDDVILADVRHLPIRLESVNQVSIMETTEHLDKNEGEQLLRQLSNTNTLLTTPLDFHDWASWENLKRDTRHRHHSHWTPEDLEKLGYTTHIERFDPLKRLIFRTRGIVVAESRTSNELNSARDPAQTSRNL